MSEEWPIRFAYDKAALWPVGHGYDAHAPGQEYTGITLHSTEHQPGQSFAAVCTFLRDSELVSAHYVVGPAGEIQRVLDPRWRAWHAGYSIWQGRPRCNNYMIGIEIYHQAGGGAYPAPQMAALTSLCRLLMAERPGITRAGVVAHRWIALPPGRKADPTDWPDPALQGWITALVPPKEVPHA